MEIRFWWSIPLATFIWLAIILEFGGLLNAPETNIPTSLTIDAQLVELSTPAPAPAPAQKIIRDTSVNSEKKPPVQPVSQQEFKPVTPPPSSEAAAPVHPLTEKITPKVETPLIQPPAAHQAPPSPDLTSYINMHRARKMAVENVDDHNQPSAMLEHRPNTADEKRMENIRKNLQQQGTSGIFQIISIGVRTARFSFRGWTTDYTNSRREIIEVDAGVNGDIERAIIRRMIELIRTHYKENFNWESQRLNRVVVLSARMEDNDGLEDFLMREFFGPGVASQREIPRH